MSHACDLRMRGYVGGVDGLQWRLWVRGQEATREAFMKVMTWMVEGCEFTKDKDNVQYGRVHR